AAIRNTTNELFLAFKLKGIKTNPKLRQYSLIHKFFTTITLKDHKTLNQIAFSSRAKTSNINNNTRGFMDALNELLNKDLINDTENSNKDNFQDHVSKFLTNLDYLKDNKGVNKSNLDINNQIVDILRIKDPYNITQNRESDENSLLSDDEFWVPEKSGRRIYLGDKAKIKYFPFMASIQIFNSFQCGGCIVKSDLVITAASCLQLAWNNRFFRENPAFLSVRVGSTFYNGAGESIGVLEVYFHPEYNPQTLQNNICLLRLMSRIHFKKKRSSVKKIDFDRSSSSLPLTTDGITILGWGAKGKNFCAGFLSKGGGACNGDVGGPGIVSGILAGIVSFGSPRCGTPDAPTVFTKLGYYSDWIEGIME
ncbi:putative Trypsin alpha, partial [Operophtera brumata]